MVFEQTVGISMGTKCAPLLADLFLYSYEANFVHECLNNTEKNLARSFNFMFRYIDDVLSLNNSRFDIDDVLSLNNSRFGDFVDHIYPIKFKIKCTTDTHRSVSYIVLHIEIDSEGWLRTKLYDTRYDFNLP